MHLVGSDTRIQRVSAPYALALQGRLTPDFGEGGWPPVSALAWAAGFIDGEGCISVVTQKKPSQRSTVRARLQVMQNHLPVLEYLQGVLGGGGRIYEIARTSAHNRQLYSLILDGSQAVAAIARVAPYLMRKKQEAEVLLESVAPCWFGIRPGPVGYPDYVWKERGRLLKKLQKLK